MTIDRSALIERYRTGTDAFVAAAAGIGDAELDARTASDEWTPREIIHHLADAELRSAVRLRQLLAEDDPVIQGYDEDLYAKRLPDRRSIAGSLDAVRAARAANLELLIELSADAWSRSGTHTESGPYSVDTWLEIYTAHAHDHADQLRRARTGS
jgi:hypothetical protein